MLMSKVGTPGYIGALSLMVVSLHGPQALPPDAPPSMPLTVPMTIYVS